MRCCPVSPSLVDPTRVNRRCSTVWAGSPRVIVSPIPGTTRDPIDVVVDLDGDPYRLIDTAGIRRKPKITEDADFYAVLRAREVLARADVAILMVDATEGVTHQDQRIASEIIEAGTGVVIVLNKWDAIDEEQREITERSIPDRFGFMGWAPLLRMSAKTGARIGRLGAAIEAVSSARLHRIPTSQLNRQIREWTSAHPPPVRKGRRPKLHYVVQAGVAPPTFVAFVSGENWVTTTSGSWRTICAESTTSWATRYIS